LAASFAGEKLWRFLQRPTGKGTVKSQRYSGPGAREVHCATWTYCSCFAGAGKKMKRKVKGEKRKEKEWKKGKGKKEKNREKEKMDYLTF
jgi:hypothetical protein